MSWESVLAHVILPSAVAAVAGFGAWKCGRLLRYGKDPRLTKLMWFYGLFAASQVAMAVWTGQLHWNAGSELSEMHSANAGAAHEGPHAGFVGAERINIFLAAHHVFMLASLGVAVKAFSHRQSGQRGGGAIAGIVGFAFLGPFIPIMLAVEAAMTLYLASQAALNHMDRRSPGALQVAAGFFLFFIGHLLFFLFHNPGVARNLLGDVFALVGVLLLVQLLPRRST